MLYWDFFDYLCKELVEDTYCWDGDKLTMDCPGLDDIQAKVDGKRLTLTLKRATKEFSRYFSLPDNIDRDKIAVNYKRGVIEILLPKKLPDKRDGPVSIPVKFE
jgi:HSP20 family molecular chaperone IbpA